MRYLASRRLVACRLAAVLGVAAISVPAGYASGADLAATEVPLPAVPPELPSPDGAGVIALPDALGDAGGKRVTTLDADLQAHLTAYLVDSRSPIAAVVVVDAATGAVLALAQGRAPAVWGGRTHTALHAGFPAASLFKTVVTAAAFEIAGLEDAAPLGLTGGCQHVRETGDWMKEKDPRDGSRMTLRRAYGASCNGFFAKIAVNHLGLGPIVEFARRFGWETGVPADFHLDKSPFMPPAAATSSTHTVGRFAAGFGYVGLSAAHAAWMMLAVANQGAPMPLKLFRATPPAVVAAERLFSPATAARVVDLLEASVKHGGTAAFAFRRGKYRKLAALVGGKTGTLTGSSPRGTTTWFAGVAPLSRPQVIVASVVVLDERWHIKAPNLAAEAFWAYFEGLRRAPPAAVSTLGGDLSR